MKYLLLLLAVVLFFAVRQYVVASESKPHLVVFSAKWCGACQAAKPIVDEIEAGGYKVVRFDADEHPDVLRRYGVRSLPTFIVYKDGKVVLRTNSVQAVKAYFNAG
jgi:thioredoxin 1